MTSIVPWSNGTKEDFHAFLDVHLPKEGREDHVHQHTGADRRIFDHNRAARSSSFGSFDQLFSRSKGLVRAAVIRKLRELHRLSDDQVEQGLSLDVALPIMSRRKIFTGPHRRVWQIQQRGS
jgi:hypothetical protein